MDKKYYSLFYKYFSEELFRELYIISKLNLDNNTKGYEIKKMLTKFDVPYMSLGSGTNRFGVLIDGYAVKIALDEHGMTDNRREFKYAPYLYPYCLKVYEAHNTGIIAVTEYLDLFTLDDYHRHQEDMRRILKIVGERYLIGDIGITTKNYINWGIRHGVTDEVVMMDFAYIYDVAFGTFRCMACNKQSLLHYDNDFNYLICPECGHKYSFAEIRKRISKQREMEEIGNIHEQGYTLYHKSESLEVNPNYLISDKPKKKEKKLDYYDMQIKEIKQKIKDEKKLDSISIDTEPRKYNDLAAYLFKNEFEEKGDND